MSEQETRTDDEGKGFAFLTLQETANLLRLDYFTVYEYAQKGHLPCIKFGLGKKKTYRVDKRELEKWIDRHTVRHVENKANSILARLHGL